MITRWYQSSKSSNVLTPKNLQLEYENYLNVHDESYVLALTITNFRDIVATCLYGKAKEIIKEFIETLKVYFPDSLIGSVVDGDFVVITNESIQEIDHFFKGFIHDIHQKYMDNVFPIEIKFQCGVLFDVSKNINEDIRRATVAMLYPRSKSIYVQYYSEEIDLELQKQNEKMQKIDDMLHEKRVAYHPIEITDLDNNHQMTEIRMMKENGEDLYCPQTILLFKKFCRFTKLDSYMMNYLLEKVTFHSNEFYILNFSFLSIYFNYYSFLKNLKELIEGKGLNASQFCINIDYVNYEDNLTGLLYVTREIQSYGFKVCLQEFGILEKSYSLMIAASIEVDYIKVGKNVLIKAMNEERLALMLRHFIAMYLELGIIPIFTDVESEYQKEFIKNISNRCLIRFKNR